MATNGTRVPVMRKIPLTSDEIHKQVMQEIAEHLRSGAMNIGAYVDAYTEAALFNPRHAVVARPVQLHPILAQFAREIVWDVLTIARLDTVKP